MRNPPNPDPGSEAPSDPNQDPAWVLRERYKDLLAQVWTVKDDCPICGTDQWTIGDLADFPIRITGSPAGTVVHTTRVYPMVPVFCNNCGFTHLFHHMHLANREGDD